MAIFTVIGWTVQLAEYFGLISAEPPDAPGRAYVLANQCLTRLKSDLAGQQLLNVEPKGVTYLTGGCQARVWVQEHALWRALGSQPQECLLHLGDGGEVAFQARADGLDFAISACDQGHQHRLHASVRASTPPAE